MTNRNRFKTMFGVGLICASFALMAQSTADTDWLQQPPAAASGGSVALAGLTPITAQHWNTASVRLVLQAFAFGGHASDRQIVAWANMKPEDAIVEMLNFEQPNTWLSTPVAGGRTAELCHSLTALQSYWGSNQPQNPMRLSDRSHYSLLNQNSMQLSPVSLFLVWARAMHTRGCNPFLHKMAFYLTNYHASIHVRNAGIGLIRDYYDDTVAALMAGEDFVGLMLNAARNGAVAFAYGHATNIVDPRTGIFHGNDDFAREYFQLLFGIEGITENPVYHEEVSIENNAELLTGMMLDLEPERFESVSRLDWLLSTIDFSDHRDASGRMIYNRSTHFDFREGAGSCLEILHRQVCGASAEEKLRALGPIAAAHAESMASIPLELIRFFADSDIDTEEAAALQLAWADAHFDVLRFVRAYATSTRFHSPDTFKYWSAFERNLIIHNATILDNEESFARPFFAGPLIRMSAQGALPFAPIRDVFGGQTGDDAANDRYVFKNAWGSNVDNPATLAAVEEYYRLDAAGPVRHWQKHWDQTVPRNEQGKHIVGEVAEWLWNRLIADAELNFDLIARAQVYSLLATGFDFASVVDRSQPEAVFSSQDISGGAASAVYAALSDMEMNLTDPAEQHHIGMAINFISMLPYAFAMGGKPE